MEEIFHKLPYNAIAICKLVCKRWDSIISSPNFINDHYNRLRVQGNNTHLIILEYNNCEHTFDFLTLCHSDLVDDRSSSNNNNNININKAAILEEISSEWKCYGPRLIGSYNGLVAISCENKLILWNPLTSKHSFAKVNVYESDDHWASLLYGLCYDKFKDEYSVVVGVNYYEYPSVSPTNLNRDITNESIEVFLYDFKDDSHKKLHWNISLERSLVDTKSYNGEIGKVIQGAPHWVNPNMKPEILYFDSREEVFKEMGRPNCCVEKKLLGLAAMNGENELGCVVDDVDSSCFEIWVMKEYGNVESWTNLYTFSYMNLINNFWCMTVRYLDVMGFMPNNGKLLIYLNDEVLLVYDVHEGNVREIKEKDRYTDLFESVTFEPKLISPPHLLRN